MPIDPKDPNKTIIKGTTKKIDTRDMSKLKPITDFKADKKMISQFGAKKEILKRADDLVATAESAAKKGNKKLILSTAKAATAAGDKSTLKRIMSIARKGGLMKKIGKKAASIIPFASTVAGVASAISSGDASAAIPDEIRPTDAGPKKGTLQHKMESGSRLTPEERKTLMNRIMDKNR
jgi:hypothetical protein